MKNIALNRKARFSYTIEDTFECGLVLKGTEVKALRAGLVNLSDAYAGPQKGELFLFNVHIGPCPYARPQQQHAPKRARKLLVHKRERHRLMGARKREGLTLVPLSLYFNDRGLVKLSLGLARGKKLVDKRASIKEREWNVQKGRLLRGKD